MEAEMVRIDTEGNIVRRLKETQILKFIPDLITDLGKIGHPTIQRGIESYSLAAQVLIIAARHNYPFSDLITVNIRDDGIAEYFDQLIWQMIVGDVDQISKVTNKIFEINEASYTIITSGLWRQLTKRDSGFR